MSRDAVSLRLDASIPRVWRSPDEIQFGVDRPILTLTHVTGIQERLIAALEGGVTAEGLDMLARRAGGGPAAAADLLHTLGPVLNRVHAAPPPVPRVLVCGAGRAAALIAHLLHLSGCEPVTAPAGQRPGDAAVPEEIDAAVLVADYVISPAVTGRWLRRDIPHLPVVFGDTGVRVGPFVHPGCGPCLRCLHLAATDADPAWPAIATQLGGRAAPSHGASLDLDAAMTVLAALGGGARAAVPVDARRSLTLREGCPPATVSHRRHPACGCASLSGTATAHAGRAAPSARPN